MIHEFFYDLPTWPFMIVAAIMTILGGFQIQRYVLYRNACEKFRKSFAAELQEFKRNKGNVYHVFKNSIQRHATAIEEFRPFAKNQKAFEKAWQRYQNTYTSVDAYISECDGYPSNHIHTNPLNGLEVLLNHAKH